jgi:hypothetical protein
MSWKTDLENRFKTPPERSKEKPGQSLLPTKDELRQGWKNDKARVKKIARNALSKLGKGIQTMSKSKNLKESRMGWMPGATGHDTWSKETKEKMKKVHRERARVERNAKRRAEKEAGKNIKNYPTERGTSVPRAMTAKEKRIFKEQFLHAILTKDYTLAESMFEESIGRHITEQRKKKKQEVAAKMGGSPFKGASMKHYRKQIRAAVKKMKASTKIVDGPEKTMRHVHEGTEQ